MEFADFQNIDTTTLMSEYVPIHTYIRTYVLNHAQVYTVNIKLHNLESRPKVHAFKMCK